MKAPFRAFRQHVYRFCARSLGRSSFQVSGPLVVVAPHPDDETMGCGGLLARAAARGAEARVVVLTDGDGAHRGCSCGLSEAAVGERRRFLCRRALEVLGSRPGSVEFLGQTDGALPRRGDAGFGAMANTLTERIRALCPDAVFAPHPLEGWSDHAAAEELTRAAVSRLENPPRLFHYCVWFWFSLPLRRAWRCDWRNSRILDISDVQDLKRQALSTYLNALAPCGAPWVGRLPRQFLKAFEWDHELFFEVPKREAKRQER